MRKCSVATLFVFALTCSTVFAAEPTALEIAEVMNNGVELGSEIMSGENSRGFEDLYEVQNVEILNGGQTSRGDYLYICNATINWKMNREEFVQQFTGQIEGQAEKAGAAGGLAIAAASMAIQFLPEFKKGEKLKDIRFRVRIERAGDDWIAANSKVVERNPLPEPKVE